MHRFTFRWWWIRVQSNNVNIQQFSLWQSEIKVRRKTIIKCCIRRKIEHKTDRADTAVFINFLIDLKFAKKRKETFDFKWIFSDRTTLCACMDFFSLHFSTVGCRHILMNSYSFKFIPFWKKISIYLLKKKNQNWMRHTVNFSPFFIAVLRRTSNKRWVNAAQLVCVTHLPNSIEFMNWLLNSQVDPFNIPSSSFLVISFVHCICIQYR